VPHFGKRIFSAPGHGFCLLNSLHPDFFIASGGKMAPLRGPGIEMRLMIFARNALPSRLGNS
jgi:hypothetical protein